MMEAIDETILTKPIQKAISTLYLTRKKALSV